MLSSIPRSLCRGSFFFETMQDASAAEHGVVLDQATHEDNRHEKWDIDLSEKEPEVDKKVLFRHLDSFGTIGTMTSSEFSSTASSDGSIAESTDDEELAMTNDYFLQDGNEHDCQLILQAQVEEDEQRLLAAARLLQQVQDKSLLKPHHWDLLLDKSPRTQNVMRQHSSSMDQWHKQAEMHTKHHDMMTFYRYDKDNLTVRIDVLLDPSLLVPLIAVLNESDLWSTWMPYWKYPVRTGVRETRRLETKKGRGNQLALMGLEIPILGRCDTVIETTTTDDIDANNTIIVEAKSVNNKDEGKPFELGFNAEFTIQPCPNDHPARIKSKQVGLNSKEPQLMLLTGTLCLTPSIDYFTRAFAGPFFAALLGIARDVRDGKRSEHSKAMSDNYDSTYAWVEERVDLLVSKL